MISLFVINTTQKIAVGILSKLGVKRESLILLWNYVFFQHDRLVIFSKIRQL